MIDEEERPEGEQQPQQISLAGFWKYDKETKVSILANLILEKLNYPIMTEEFLMEAVEKYKLMEMDDNKMEELFLKIMKEKMFGIEFKL